MRGDGPVAPRAIEMLGGEDHTMLDLSGAAFDLLDSGVTGPPHPGPLDAYVWLPARRDGRGDGAAARQCRPTHRHSGACDREAAKRSGAPRRDAGAVSRSVATSAGKVVERRSGWDLDGRGEGRFESSQYTALVFGGPASARPSDLSVMPTPCGRASSPYSNATSGRAIGLPHRRSTSPQSPARPVTAPCRGASVRSHRAAPLRSASVPLPRPAAPTNRASSSANGLACSDMPKPNRNRPRRGKRENQGFPRGYAPITQLRSFGISY